MILCPCNPVEIAASLHSLYQAAAKIVISSIIFIKFAGCFDCGCESAACNPKIIITN